MEEQIIKQLSEMMEQPSYTIETYAYGTDPYQVGDLYIPKYPGGQIICLFHGGFWKMPYDRFQMNALCVRLVQEGHCVWNIEYRRTGYVDGGWPGTFEDAVAAVNYVSELAEKHMVISPERLIIAGHSAGGHLALWLSYQGEQVTQQRLSLTPQTIIAMAPIVDLIKTYHDIAGKQPVFDLLGGVSPLEYPRRYVVTSPIAMLPLGIPQWIMHGDQDSMIPVTDIRDYVEQATQLGDNVTYKEVVGGEHMDFLDPHHPAIDCLCDWLAHAHP